ncbi:MAG: thymidine phosphorylase, partial [Pseudomonadota bacterium]|nr:thymidine phosphorylase [Pseudomonadota bacterium]
GPAGDGGGGATAVGARGGGRRRAADESDPRLGLSPCAGVGALVDGDFPLARIHAASRDDADRAAARVLAAYRVGAEAPEEAEPVLSRLGPEDVA